MQKLKRNDEIVVLTGKDKGRTGKIQKILGGKVLVDNVNIVKKHVKGNPMTGAEGGIIEKSMPVHISNIAIYNPETQKADRVGFRYLEDGNKIRFYKKTGENID